MQSFLTILGVLLLCLPLQGQGYNSAQNTVFSTSGAGGVVAPGTAASIQQNNLIKYHQLFWTVTGTVSACQVSLDTSSNGTSWTVGGAIAAQTCSATGSSSVTGSVTANYVRVNVSTFTGTGSITIQYEGWVANPSGGGGSGTITGVTAGTGLTGGGTSGNVTVSIATGNAVWVNGTTLAGPFNITDSLGNVFNVTGTNPHYTLTLTSSSLLSFFDSGGDNLSFNNGNIGLEDENGGFISTDSGSPFVQDSSNGSLTQSGGNLVETGAFTSVQNSLAGCVAPTANHGTLTGCNNGGYITGLAAQTSVTVTFSTPNIWVTWVSCTANTSVTAINPYLSSAPTTTSVTFNFASLTGTLYYHCDGA